MTSNEQKKKARKINSLYIFAFCIPLLTVLLGFILGGFAPFGTKDVLSGSSQKEYYTYYYELYDQVHESEIFHYDATNSDDNINTLNESATISSEAGDSFFSTLVYRISDPTNMIILLFPRKYIMSVLDILFMIKIALCSLFFAIFLSNHKSTTQKNSEKMAQARTKVIEKITKKEKKKKKKDDIVLGFKENSENPLVRWIVSFDWIVLALSIAYSLSEYFISSLLNPAFIMAVALFPLIMKGLDDIFNGKKWTSFAIFYALSFYANFYITLITSVFIIFYLLFHTYDSTENLIESIVKVAKGVVCSLLSSAIIIIPSVTSNAFSNEISLEFPTGAVKHSIFDYIRQLMTRSIPDKISIYGLGIDAYVGIALLVLLFLYLFNGNIRLTERIKMAVLLLLLCSGSIVNTTNFLFNGFKFYQNPTQVYGYIISFLAILIAYEAIMNIRFIRVAFIHITGLLCFILIVSGILLSTGYESASPFIISLEFTFAYYVLTLIFKNKSMTPSCYKVFFALLFVFEICTSFIYNTTKLGEYFTTLPSSRTKQVKQYETARYILSNHPGSKILITGSIYDKKTPLLTSLEGYDYIVYPEGDTSDSFLNKLETYNDCDIYQNPYSLKFAIADSSIDSFIYDKTRIFDSENTLAARLFANNIYSNGQGSLDYEFDAAGSNITVSFNCGEDGDYYGNFNSFAHIGNSENGTTKSVMQSVVKLAQSYSCSKFESDSISKLYDTQSKIRSGINFDNSSSSIQSDINGYLLVNTTSDTVIKNASTNEKSRVLDGSTLLVPIVNGDNSLTISKNYSKYVLAFLLSLMGFAGLILLALKEMKFFKNDVKKAIKFVEENKIYIASIAVNTLIIVVLNMITSSFPFGNRFFIQNDGISQMFPGSIQNINSAKTGNFFSLILTNESILNPSGTSVILKILWPLTYFCSTLTPSVFAFVNVNLASIIKFIFSSTSLIFYLTNRHDDRLDKTDWRLFPLGLAYSLSSYAITYVTYGSFSFMINLPIILLALEYLIYKNNKVLYIVFLWYLMSEPYYAFMTCEFLFLYFLTLDFDDFKDFIKKGIRFALCSICSAMLYAFYLIPYYSMTTTTQYAVADASAKPSIFRFFKSFFAMVDQFKAGQETIDITQDSSHAAIYFGIAILIFLPLYALCKKIELSRRIRTIVLIILLFLALNNEYLNYVFHGFHVQSNVPNRFAIFMIFLCIVCIYDVILNIDSIKKNSIVICGIVTSVILAFIWFAYNIKLDTATALSLIIIACYLVAIIIFGLMKKSNAKKIGMRIASGILIVELLINCVLTLPHFNTRRVSTIYATTDTINELADRTPDLYNNFVNTELVGTDLLNLGMMSDINTITSFGSTTSADNYYMLSKWGIKTSGNSVMYQIGNPLADMMLHLKYNIVDTEDAASTSIYPMIDQSKNLLLTENPNYLRLAFNLTENDAFSKWDASSYTDYNNTFAYQNAFVQSQIGQDLYTTVAFDDQPASDTDAAEASMINTLDVSDSYQETASNNEVETLRDVHIELNDSIQGDVYISENDVILYLGTADEDNHSFDFPLNTKYTITKEANITFGIAVLNQNALDNLYAKLSKEQSSNEVLNKSSIEFDFNNESDSTLYIGLPNLGALTSYVDGQEVSHTTTAGGMSIKLPAGKHHIEIKYHIEGLTKGIIITSITIVILIVYNVVIRSSRKRKKKEETNDTKK